jgi:hypothetical protein
MSFSGPLDDFVLLLNPPKELFVVEIFGLFVRYL